MIGDSFCTLKNPPPTHKQNFSTDKSCMCVRPTPDPCAGRRRKDKVNYERRKGGRKKKGKRRKEGKSKLRRKEGRKAGQTKKEGKKKKVPKICNTRFAVYLRLCLCLQHWSNE